MALLVRNAGVLLMLLGVNLQECRVVPVKSLAKDSLSSRVTPRVLAVRAADPLGSSVSMERSGMGDACSALEGRAAQC